MKYLVYKLTSPSNKSYIGWTSVGLTIRLRTHIRDVNRGSKRKICNALRKYPIENWIKEILFESDDKDISLQKEIELIKQYNTIIEGYNLSTGGEGSTSGIKLSQEHKDAISRALLGKPKIYKSYESKHKLRHPITDDMKQKISNTLLGSSNNARTYEIVWKTEKIEIIKNLKFFCDNNNLNYFTIRNYINRSPSKKSPYISIKRI